MDRQGEASASSSTEQKGNAWSEDNTMTPWREASASAEGTWTTTTGQPSKLLDRLDASSTRQTIRHSGTYPPVRGDLDYNAVADVVIKHQTVDKTVRASVDLYNYCTNTFFETIKRPTALGLFERLGRIARNANFDEPLLPVIFNGLYQSISDIQYYSDYLGRRKGFMGWADAFVSIEKGTSTSRFSASKLKIESGKSRFMEILKDGNVSMVRQIEETSAVIYGGLDLLYKILSMGNRDSSLNVSEEDKFDLELIVKNAIYLHARLYSMCLLIMYHTTSLDSRTPSKPDTIDIKYIQTFFAEDSELTTSTTSNEIPKLTQNRFNKLRKEYFNLFGTFYDVLKENWLVDRDMVREIDEKLHRVLGQLAAGFCETGTTGNSLCIHCHASI